MKQFIVLLAVLPLMLVFLAQFSAEQQLSARMAAVDDAVYTAKEMAKQEGCFSKKIRDRLCSDICSRIKGLKPSDIIFGSGTDTKPVYRVGSSKGKRNEGIIHYQVSVPIWTRDPIGSFLGVKNGSGRRYYVIDSCTTSELLP